MIYTFDGVNKLITLGVGTILSVTDLWSRTVDWWLTSDNSKFIFPFSQVGGDVIDVSSGVSIPFYMFLKSGWKIKPAEAHYTLSVRDAVLLVDGGGDPFINTVGNFTVRINYQQPVQVITVSTGGSGSSPEDIATAVRTELAEELNHLTELENGLGLTNNQATMLLELYRLMGLDPTRPLIVNSTTRTAGSEINQTIDSNTTRTILTRNV